ncbi:exported hypothetical protein [Nitrosomonas nitrosa]|uniref:Uncharacterized protein n=2 Tax=Nitrosomonas nitrosa TaxID=52442 RepID=A0A8H9DBQ1_9PROT|nr:exported hypothetical protein [Nitrosomonas nitrosa]
MIIIYKNYKFFDVLLLIALLALPLMSHAQAKENEVPSLEDTLQWVAENLENYQFGHHTLKFTYFRPIINGCKITITRKTETLSGKPNDESRVTGLLSDIDPDFIIIDNADSIIPVRLDAYLKKNSTPFDRQSYIHYYKEISNYEDVTLTIYFHSLTFANRFKRAIAHAAKLCALQEASKSRKEKELF